MNAFMTRRNMYLSKKLRYRWTGTKRQNNCRSVNKPDALDDAVRRTNNACSREKTKTSNFSLVTRKNISERLYARPAAMLSPRKKLFNLLYFPRINSERERANRQSFQFEACKLRRAQTEPATENAFHNSC